MNGATTRTSARTREGATRRPPPAGAPRRFARPAFGIVATIVLAAGLSGGAIAAAASAASVTPRSGTSQNTEIGTAFPGVLVATVTGLATGTKCPNLTFSAPSSGPSAVFSQSGTGTESPSPLLPTANPTGECTYQSSHLSANDTVGSYSVTASIGAGGSPGTFSLTNDGIMASAGSHQTAQDGSAFSTPLQVTVYADGAPAKGVSVSFDAPGSGPSGVFSTTNTDTATVATDATGVATAPSLTADDTAGSYTVTATTSAVPGSASFALTNSAAGVAASLDALAGSKQTAAVGTTFADPLEVKVTDANGNPVQGAQVTFAAETSSSGASGTFVGSGGTATVATDSSGVAVSPEIQANDAGGTFTVTATTAGLNTAAVFTLTNLGAARIAASKGTKQSVVIGGTFADPLEVKLTNADGKPVEAAQVSFTVGSASSGASGAFATSGGTATVSTNSNGIAVSPAILANDVAGTFKVTASTAGLEAAASFILTNLAAAPASITAGAGVTQKAPVDHSFSVPLSVTVTDAQKNPVSGVDVTFRAPSSGPSGTFSATAKTSVVVATNSSGIAVAPAFHANGVSGGYIVTASVARLSPPASFALVNQGSSTSTSSAPSRPDSTVVALAAARRGDGYWLVGSNGAVYAFGGAGYHGSLPGLRDRVSDVVGIASTPSGGGYWLVGSNGAVYAFGDAGYHGSLPGLRVRVSDIVGIASTPSGAGYWLVGKDGGVYAFGDAGYHGSLPGLRVHLSDVVGVASSPGGGYWLVASDGEVYGFGDAASRGSAPARGIHVSDIVGIASSPDGRGYWLAGANGRILTFGDAAA